MNVFFLRTPTPPPHTKTVDRLASRPPFLLFISPIISNSSFSQVFDISGYNNENCGPVRFFTKNQKTQQLSKVRRYALNFQCAQTLFFLKGNFLNFFRTFNTRFTRFQNKCQSTRQKTTSTKYFQEVWGTIIFMQNHCQQD